MYSIDFFKWKKRLFLLVVAGAGKDAIILPFEILERLLQDHYSKEDVKTFTDIVNATCDKILIKQALDEVKTAVTLESITSILIEALAKIDNAVGKINFKEITAEKTFLKEVIQDAIVSISPEMKKAQYVKTAQKITEALENLVTLKDLAIIKLLTEQKLQDIKEKLDIRSVILRYIGINSKITNELKGVMDISSLLLTEIESSGQLQEIIGKIIFATQESLKFDIKEKLLDCNIDDVISQVRRAIRLDSMEKLALLQSVAAASVAKTWWAEIENQRLQPLKSINLEMSTSPPEWTSINERITQIADSFIIKDADSDESDKINIINGVDNLYSQASFIILQLLKMGLSESSQDLQGKLVLDTNTNIKKTIIKSKIQDLDGSLGEFEFKPTVNIQTAAEELQELLSEEVLIQLIYYLKVINEPLQPLQDKVLIQGFTNIRIFEEFAKIKYNLIVKEDIVESIFITSAGQLLTGGLNIDDFITDEIYSNSIVNAELKHQLAFKEVENIIKLSSSELISQEMQNTIAMSITKYLFLRDWDPFTLGELDDLEINRMDLEIIID